MVYKKYSVKPSYNDKFVTKAREDRNILGKLLDSYGEPIIKESDDIYHNQEGVWEIDGTVVLGECTHIGLYPFISIIGLENKIKKTKKDIETRLSIKLEELNSK